VLRLEAHMGTVDSMQWSNDGQILTVSTSGGDLVALLGDLPGLSARHGNRFALLSSLKEIVVTDILAGDARLRVPTEIEPRLLAVGPHHVMAGLNDRAFFYRLRVGTDGTAGPPASSREYSVELSAAALSAAHCVALCDGRVVVHTIEGRPGAEDGMMTLNEGEVAATAVAAAGEFLFWGSSEGDVHVWHTPTSKRIETARFAHPDGPSSSAGRGSSGEIRAIYPNSSGTRMVVVDAGNRSWFYNPIDNHCARIEDAFEPPNDCLWDSADWGLFSLTSGGSIKSYLHRQHTIRGPVTDALGDVSVERDGRIVRKPRAMDVPSSLTPVSVIDGVLVARDSSGTVSRSRLQTHSALDKSSLSTRDGTHEACRQAMQLNRLQTAWELASRLKDRMMLIALANQAMENLNPQVATRVYRALGDAGMVHSLEQVSDVEDASSLAAHLAVLFANFDLAESLFLKSSTPLEALQMRRDMLQWDAALRLARSLAPEQSGEISIECARQLEVRGEIDKALATYEQAERDLPPDDTIPGQEEKTSIGKLHQRVNDGLARCLLRTGSLRRGLELAREGDAALALECASILEGLKQASEAAELYKRAGDWERAANILIMSREFSAVAEFIDKVHSPRLLVAYAKAQEQVGAFEQALGAFERARATDDMVRLYLEKLHKIDDAASLTRSSRSTVAANMMAAHFQEVENTRGSVEFLLLAGRPDDAFNLAVTSGNMEIYTDVVSDGECWCCGRWSLSQGVLGAAMGGEVPDAEYLRIASYFESHGDFGQAGRYFSRASHFHKALNCFLDPSNGDKCLNDAVEVVGRSKNDTLALTLIDYLTGDTDGIPKDPQYIFKIYIALKNFEQAAKAALVISENHRSAGNYRVAHGVLLDTHSQLVGECRSLGK
jgi:WD repeat-containing protein 19